MSGKRVLVIGCGFSGQKVIRQLVKSPVFSKIVIGDIDGPRVSKLVSELATAGKEVTGTTLDASDELAVQKTSKGADVIVNVTGPYDKTAVPTVKAAINNRIGYVDINIQIPSTRAVLAMDDDARMAGISVLVGFGDVPGLINTVARYGSDKLDEVEDILLAAGGNRYPFLTGAAFERIWRNMHGPPVHGYRDGRFVERQACGDREMITLPGLPGEFEVMNCNLAPVYTLPRTITGVKQVTCKAGMSPPEVGNDLFARLFQWGALTHEPLLVKGTSVKPSDFTLAFLASPAHASAINLAKLPVMGGMYVRVRGKKNGGPAQFTYSYRDTKFVLIEKICTLAAEMLACNEIKARGVLAPEALDPKPFLKLALENGVVMRETEESII